MQITLDKQVVSNDCRVCKANFSVVRGSIYDTDVPIGLYLIGLHGHYENGRMAKLAIALLGQMETKSHPMAVAIDVLEMPEQVGFTVTDWPPSLWKDERYLGEMLDRAKALNSPQIDLFFHVADHVVRDLPEVKAYFG